MVSGGNARIFWVFMAKFNIGYNCVKIHWFLHEFIEFFDENRVGTPG